MPCPNQRQIEVNCVPCWWWTSLKLDTKKNLETPQLSDGIIPKVIFHKVVIEHLESDEIN